MRKQVTGAVLLASLLVVATPVVAKKPLADIPLQWTPTTTVAELGAVDLTGLGSVRLAVLPFADNRPQPKLIGENREDEDKGKVLTVTTRDDVAAFATERFADALGRLGLEVASEGATARLSAEVKSFLVTERDTYLGDLVLRVELADRDGRVQWSGTTAGAAKRFGRSYKAENYMEVIADSLLEAAYRLVSNDGFREALKKTAPAAP